MQEYNTQEEFVETPITQQAHLDSRKNNIFAWLMAFVPIVGTIIGYIIGFGYACLALNVILCYVDEDSLKKQGVNIDELGELTFFVPYYLHYFYSLILVYIY